MTSGGGMKTGNVPEKRGITKMVVAIFSGRVLYRGSQLRIWQPRNRGTFADFLPVSFPELGQCVHIQLPAVNGKQFRQQKLAS